jgi:glycosyltransferase involved in cell wall biosynthesis
MRRLRIAVYHNLHSGGAKRVTIEHLRRLSARHEVMLFTLSTADQAFAGAVDEDHIKSVVHDYKPAPYLRSPFGRFNPIVGMRNLKLLEDVSLKVAADIDARGFDAVLLHPCQVTQSPLVLNGLRTPALYYCHELPRRVYDPDLSRPYSARSSRQVALDRFDPVKTRIFDLLKAYDYNAAIKATQITANSKYTRSNAERVYRRQVSVCPPGVDAGKFQPGESERERLVLSVGALTPFKGFDFIIQAIGTTGEAQRPPLLIISNYQEPRELAFLTALAAQCKVQVEFRANVSDAELQGWYARAGCMAYAPVREPFGLAALEAMAAGAPVVGVNEGGVRETIVDGVTGVLAPRNAAEFGQRIMEVLRDPRRAERYTAAARKHVIARFNWEDHMAQIEALLQDVAKARKWAPAVSLP